MLWFKKKSTEIPVTIDEVPLVDQPPQISGKTNEELLSELKRLVGLRLNMRWISPALWCMFLIGSFYGINHALFASNQIPLDLSLSQQDFTRQLQIKEGVFKHYLYLSFLSYLLLAGMPVAGYFRSKLNSNRIGLLISELVRRKETKVVLVISQLSSVGNRSLFDPNRSLYFQACLELLPYLHREDFDRIPWDGQFALFGSFVQSDPKIRLQGKTAIIENGNKTTLKMLKATYSSLRYLHPEKKGMLGKFFNRFSYAEPYFPSRLNAERFLEYGTDISECIQGIEARLSAETKQAQLLRPSSANSDGSELLRAAKGGVSAIASEELLRPNSPNFPEETTSEIASNYLPSPSQNSNEISENRTRN